MNYRRLPVFGIAVAALTTLGTAGTAQASPGTVYGPEWRQIINAESRLCVDIKQEDGSNTDGARAQQWNCTGVDEQHWLPKLVPGTRDIYTFVEGRNHKCLDVRGGSTSAGTILQQWTCNGTPAQQWQLRSTNEIVSQVNGQCMDTMGGSKGTFLMQWPCNGNLAQRWQLVRF